MPKERDLNAGDSFSATFTDALTEFLGTSAPNFRLQIRSSDPTVLEVPGGTGNSQAAIAISGRWRFNTTTVSRGGVTGAARSLDVYVTSADNSFTGSGGVEVDASNRTFGLSIVETGASPTGVVLSRKVGTAQWDGSKFITVTPSVGWVDQPAALSSGRSIIDTAETIPSGQVAAATPDRISNLVVPTGGILFVSFWAILTKTAGGTGETAGVGLYLNGAQIKSRFGATPPSGASGGVVAAGGVFGGFVAITDALVYTEPTDSGMGALLSGNGSPVASNASPGHLTGAFIPVDVAPGTHTLEVRYARTASFTGTVSYRRLFAEVRKYGT